MFLAHTANSRRWALVTGAAVTAGALLTGCSGGGTSSSSASGSTDTINYALPANFTPNWILPVGTAAHLNTNNSSISQSLWEPLIALLAHMRETEFIRPSLNIDVLKAERVEDIVPRLRAAAAVHAPQASKEMSELARKL